MYLSTVLLLLFSSLTVFTYAQSFYGDVEYRCPQHWLKYQESCYRFIKSPMRPREEARKNCQAYQSDLVTINSLDEHGFLLHQLQWQDHQHHKWYTGVKQQSGYWANEGDSTQMVNMDNAFLPESADSTFGKDYLVYAYSENLKRWGLEKVSGREEYLYICEAPLATLHNLAEDERTYEYGIEVHDPEKIPRGPYFIRQPEDRVFDVSKQSINNDISLSCLAGGYPTPTYKWFKEDYDNDRLIATEIDPLKNSRFTVSGGMLIINNPQQTLDRGSYHCKATNKFGTVRSESVELSFGFILQFNLKRSKESGEQNWGKAMYCDPPQHYPSITYYWSRDYFPNLVEQDKRVFVSNDGALYFSALEMIDRGNYSCNVQNAASKTGQNGPFFELQVNPQASYQELKFANNFPKVFPEAPKAGKDVRLECIVFGYPVPSYNWTRKGAPLPRRARSESFGRVLIIPQVQVEDQGEYVCLAYNARSAIKNSVYLSIQAEPNFTIPLVDKHIDNNADLTWTCEAFGIPDVSYTWLKNGEPLDHTYRMPPEDWERYTIQDNVLKIKQVNPDKDQAMYQCAAKNQLKTKYSSAQLRILALKPSFKKRPMESETYAAEGGNVTIVCNPEAAPRPKFVWKKDGNVIGAGGRRRILESGNLIISPVSRSDEGTYVCTASNLYGTGETRGRLIVLRATRFIEQLPPRIKTAVNYNQTLRCRADTEEMLDVAYIWRHNGRRIRDEDMITNSHIIVDEGVLDIVNATFAESGEYECIVKSAVGQISTKTEIFVEGPPGPPGGIQVVNIVKTSVTLRWTDGAFNGRPILGYAVSARTNWNSTWVTISEGVQAIEVDRYNGRKEAYLENVLNPFTVYEFRVSAFNEFGYGPPSLPSPQHHTPPEKPTKAPSNVGGGGGKIGDLTITWDRLKPSEQNAPGIYYIVYWRMKGREKEFHRLSLKQHGDIGMTVVSIAREYFYTEHEVKVQAGNDVGVGPISDMVTIFSAEDMPQVAPQQVKAESYNSTALNVSWAPIEQTRERIHGKLMGHRIKYWKKDGREEEAVYYLSRSTRPWSLVVGLQPDTYYKVKVMAYNSAGEGPESEPFIERTYRKAPQQPPSSVNVFGLNPSTIHVVWRYVQPSYDEEPIIGYKIRIWEVDQDMSTANDTIILSGSKLEAVIKTLSPGKVYNLRVLAFSNGGDGRMSSPTHTFQMGDDFGKSIASRRILDTALGIAVIILLSTFQWT